MAEENPLVSFHFAVDLQGMAVGFFTEASGLGSEHEVIEHKVVTESGQEIIMKIPGRMKYENMTFKRGITSNLDMWDWRKMVEDGQVEDARRDGSVVMYDQSLSEVARWNFERAWPIKVTGPQPKADSNEIGLEEMVIAVEKLVRVK